MKYNIVAICFLMSSIMCLANVVRSANGAVHSRFSSVSEQSVSAKDYVQDGLIAMWDGIENAGWGMHDPNATVWKDLIGGNDFIQLPLGVVFGPDFIELPAVQGTGTALHRYRTEDISAIEGVVSLDKWDGLVLVGFSDTAPISRWLGFRAVGTINFGNGETCADGGFLRNTIMSFSGCYTTRWNIYRNGKALAPIGPGMTWSTVPGGTPTLNKIAVSYSKSKIYSLRLYSRALTAEEIAHNYAIDKARFNLP